MRSVKKAVLFKVLAGACLLACVLFMSCEVEPDTKDGTITLRNDSKYAEDDPITAVLYQGSTVLSENSVGTGKRVTWTGVPPEVSLSIKVTDKKGRSTSANYISLDLNGKETYTYNGSSISYYNPN